MDTTGTQLVVLYTEESLILCGAADSALIREVPLIQIVLYSEVPL